MGEEGGGSGSGGGGGSYAQTALSYRNTHEAAIVHKHIQQLYALGLTPEQIGVITPYNGQLECLRDLLYEKEEAAGSDSEAKGTRLIERKVVFIATGIVLCIVFTLYMYCYVLLHHHHHHHHHNHHYHHHPCHHYHRRHV